MSGKYLGLPFDIHGGGMDLRFPHHENEIAQSEAASGKDFAKIWMHIGLLTVDGEKMSKSIGNIVNVKNLLEKWDSEVVRFFFAQAHYRSPPDFSEKALKNAKKGLARIHRVKEIFEACASRETGKLNNKDLAHHEKEFLEKIFDFKTSFVSAMDDDFNTPQAVSIIFDFVNSSNRYFEKATKLNHDICRLALDNLLELGAILTLFQTSEVKTSMLDDDLLKKVQRIADKYETNVQGKNIEKSIDLLLKKREEARNKKNWDTADAIRNDLDKIGFEIQDTSNGPVWRKK
jgi:cysteinyl-tRNA synthetase